MISNNNNEIWVFLSHSHKDYEKVSFVRNLLEERGYRPLMFYLNCLDDDSEIEDLIKREIDSRAYFILCDSKNSRQSTWVREEERYIRSKGRLYDIIDIEAEKKQIETAISHFEHRGGAFISYSHRSKAQAMIIEEILNANGYNSWTDYSKICSGADLGSDIKNSITKYSNEGFVVIILDKNYINSDFCMLELRLALGERKTNASSILLVTLDETKPSDIIELKEVPIRWIDATNCEIEQVAKKIVSFFNFYNTSYRKVYNLCWDLSGLNYKDIGEEQNIQYPLLNNIEKSGKTKLACLYILGLGVPTDIDYAISLFKDAAAQGDENAAKILKMCKQ